tara:strand:- start:367 stop:747 length:381 start_codon:yes stop_codon:yes gene_type:complete
MKRKENKMELSIHSAKTVRSEAFSAAVVATNNYIEHYLGGEDKYACGFAWVTVQPKHKGNTKLGRQEREILRNMGLEKDWTGKRYMWWNPSSSYFQNIDCKEEGARAAAKVLQGYGLDAWASSRLD